MHSDDVTISVLTDAARGTIDPRIYGLHLEHIWNCVYPSVWVGPDSPIPNNDGIRNDVVRLLAELRPTICKYPGGYFTDSYDWRDGIGPRDQRPARAYPCEPDREERNHFGTGEFVKFCRMIGAEPYLSVNVTSIEPMAAAHWVEYCNLNGDTYWAAKRREHGYEEPFNVRYWAIGNEPHWLHSAEGYVERYRHWAHFMYNTDPGIALVIGGVEPGQLEVDPWNSDGKWGERFMRASRSGQSILNDACWHARPESRETFYAFHPYFSAESRGAPDEFYRAISELAERLPGSIAATVALLDKHRGTYRRPKLCFDEYGLIFSDVGCSMAGKMTQPAPFWAAIWLACFLCICHQHPEYVGMAALPGTVNMEHELVLVDGDRAIATPSYHLFRLFRAHGGAEKLETVVAGAPDCRRLAGSSVWALASMPAGGGKATLSIINLNLDQDVSAHIEFPGRRIRSASGTLLGAPDINAENTFDLPDTVAPRGVEVAVVEDGIRYTLPAHSIVQLAIELA